jgi:hypothetical protein
MNTPEINGAAFYSCLHEDGESLYQRHPGDAIEAYLQDYPETITLYGFAPMPINSATRDRLVASALDAVLDELDEEFGDPDGEPSQPSMERLAMARSFVDEILATYDVWACTQVGEVRITVREWMDAHRPDWLSDLTDTELAAERGYEGDV